MSHSDYENHKTWLDMKTDENRIPRCMVLTKLEENQSLPEVNLI